MASLGLRSGKLPLQGGVVVPANVFTGELDKRKMNARTIITTGKKTPFQIYPGGENEQNYVLFEGDLLLAHRGRANDAIEGSQGKPSVINSFNGMLLAEDEDESDLQSRLYVLGVSRSTYNAYSPTQPAIGVAVIVVGTQTIKYNPRYQKPCFAGDLLCFSAPSVHQSVSTQLYNGDSRSRLLPHVQPLNWDDIKFILEKTIAHMRFSDDSSAKLGANKRPLQMAGEKKYANLAQIKKDALLTQFVRGAEPLVKRGLITINTPYEMRKKELTNLLVQEASQTRPLKAIVDQLVALETEKTDLLNISGLTYKGHNPMDGGFVASTTAYQDVDKDTTHAVLFLGSILGLMKTHSGVIQFDRLGHGNGSGQVQKDVVYSMMWPHVHKDMDAITSGALKTKAQVAATNPKELYEPLDIGGSRRGGMARGGLRGIRAQDKKRFTDMTARYIKLAEDSVLKNEIASATMRQEITNTIFAVALSHADPTAADSYVDAYLFTGTGAVPM